jgi:toxin ParE1/3/4
MKIKLIFAKAAHKQLRDIAHHTTREWGKAQCARYMGDLYDTCELLTEDAKLGRPCDAIYPGMQKYSVGRHVVYFYRSRKTLEIAGILHDRMLPALNLGNDA